MMHCDNVLTLGWCLPAWNNSWCPAGPQTTIVREKLHCLVYKMLVSSKQNVAPLNTLSRRGNPSVVAQRFPEFLTCLLYPYRNCLLMSQEREDNQLLERAMHNKAGVVFRNY